MTTEKDKFEEKLEKKPYLAWKKRDYVDAGEEIPDELLNDDDHTEGELMTEDDIADWVLDTQKTFSVIKQNDEEAFNKLYQGYLRDVEYLVEIKKIDETTADDILNLDNFEL